ncbi:hypothetical protein [Dyadobacter sp. 50-39]|uniref:hypothetical protein n=1 Tax=Dyadobacter sp. 50-39 TaxID=1895756 RepID=UPI0025BE17F0|nr:hypothetical protein [Dyadobacter sp. 50-39]
MTSQEGIAARLVAIFEFGQQHFAIARYQGARRIAMVHLRLGLFSQLRQNMGHYHRSLFSDSRPRFSRRQGGNITQTVYIREAVVL